MVDRQPVHPGRIALTPVPGEANTYDMVLADGATALGDPLNKATLLKDETAEAIGLDATATPNDALAKLIMGVGNYGYAITAVFQDGSPAVGVTIAGLTSITGGDCITDANGKAVGTSSSPTVTISVTGFLDISSASKSVTSTGIITPVSFLLTLKTPQKASITTSQNIKFYKDVEVDIHLIGGGTDGYNMAALNGSNSLGANGGANGNNYYVANLSLSKNTDYPLAVGARNGGNTTFLGKSSATGNNSSTGGGGGGGGQTVGNGSGGGTSPIGYPYGGSGGGGSAGGEINVSLPGGLGPNGGGNGGACTKYYDDFRVAYNGGSGYSASVPGGGGGGCGANGRGDSSGGHRGSGAGKAGAMFIRWRYVE